MIVVINISLGRTLSRPMGRQPLSLSARIIRFLLSKKFSFMSNKLAHGPVEATVYRRNTLNAWSKIANISGVFMNTPC